VRGKSAGGPGCARPLGATLADSGASLPHLTFLKARRKHWGKQEIRSAHARMVVRDQIAAERILSLRAPDNTKRVNGGFSAVDV
jgi:hypothetical protein